MIFNLYAFSNNITFHFQIYNLRKCWMIMNQKRKLATEKEKFKIVYKNLKGNGLFENEKKNSYD